MEFADETTRRAWWVMAGLLSVPTCILAGIVVSKVRRVWPAWPIAALGGLLLVVAQLATVPQAFTYSVLIVVLAHGAALVGGRELKTRLLTDQARGYAIASPAFMLALLLVVRLATITRWRP